MRLKSGIKPKLVELGFGGYHKLSEKHALMGAATDDGRIMADLWIERQIVEIKMSTISRTGRLKKLKVQIPFEALVKLEVTEKISYDLLKQLAKMYSDPAGQIPSAALDVAKENHAVTKIVVYLDGFVPRSYRHFTQGRRIVAEIEDGKVKDIKTEKYDRHRSRGIGPAWVAFSAANGRIAAGPRVEYKP